MPPPAEVRTPFGVFVVEVEASASTVSLVVLDNPGNCAFTWNESPSNAERYAAWLEQASVEMDEVRPGSIYPLQRITDPFVTDFGGQIVASLLDSGAPQAPEQADYLLPHHNVIVELKALEKDTFDQAFKERFARTFREWHERGVLMTYGRSLRDIRTLPEPCQQKCLDMLAAPLQGRVKKANGQIANTKRILNRPDAKGLLWIASDGNGDLQPDLVWFVLKRILGKKNPDGSSQYSNIDGLVYFNPRMPVEVPRGPNPGLFWLSATRDTDDHRLEECVKELGEAWIQYNERCLLGRPIKREYGGNAPLRFAGFEPRVPHIDVFGTPRPRG